MLTGMAKYDDYPNYRRLPNYQLLPKLPTLLPIRISKLSTPPTPLTDSTVTTAPLAKDEKESTYYSLKSFTWNLWVGPLPIHSLPIAGGHENQWLLPKGVSELGRVAKLTCANEAYFYDWIYSRCGKPLPLHKKPLEFSCKVLKSLKGKNINNLLQSKSMTSRSLNNLPNKQSVYHNICHNYTKSGNIENFKPYGRETINAADDDEADLSLKIKTIYLQSTKLNLHNLTLETWHIHMIYKYLPPCHNIYIDEGKVAITLENVTHCMSKPVVMDLKMGTRLFGDDCTDRSVIRSKEEKAMQRSTKTHGFHISGMYVWDKLQRLASFLPVNLAHAAKDDLLLLLAFEKFFFVPLEATSYQKLLAKFLSLLIELKQLFQNQKGLTFYGSSLLFIYDSANPMPFETAKVYMIDFAHVTLSDGIDEGYLKGLDNLIRLFYALSNLCPL